MIINKLKYIAGSAVAVTALALGSCSDYVQSVPEPPSSISDDSLNTPLDVRFLMRGIENLFAGSFGGFTVRASLMSDEGVFSRDLNGDQSYDVLDQANRPGQGLPLLPSGQPAGLYGTHGSLRKHCDTLIWRIRNKIQFTTDAERSLRDSGLYVAHFYAGAAFYLAGAYWAHTPTDFGATFDTSRVIPSTQLLQRAITRLDSARQYARGVQARYVATFKARIYQLLNDHQNALREAQQGLVRGDQPLNLRYFEFANNPWFAEAGRGQARFIVDQRYTRYFIAFNTDGTRNPGGSPDEVVRLRLIPEPIRAPSLFQQDKYSDRNSPISFLTWEENTLILAESGYRLDGDMFVVLDLINDIRSEYRMGQIDEEYIEPFTGFSFNDFDSDPEKSKVLHFLYTERDKQLWLTGMRLLDQRRFNQWHLNVNSTWQAFPISEGERELNPNGLVRYFN